MTATASSHRACASCSSGPARSAPDAPLSRRHPAGLRLPARRQARCSAAPHGDQPRWQEAAGRYPWLPAVPIRLPRQPGHPADQQRLRAGVAALRHLPKGDQLLPLRMGRKALRRYPIRHRNRPPPSRRPPRRHHLNLERLAARQKPFRNRVSNYR